MNDSAMRELSAIENFLGDGNAVRSGKDSINVVIRGPLATVVVQFKFKKNYPSSTVDFEIVDSGGLPESQVSQLETKIKQHLEMTQGLPALLALVIQIRFMLETGVPVPVHPSPLSVRRSSSVRNLSSAVSVSDPRRDHYLVYFFHKAAGVRDGSNESECLESCLESLKALGLIGDDETSDVYHEAYPEMVKHMNARLPQQVRDILTDGEVTARTSSKKERARFFKLFDVGDSPLGRGGYGSVIKAKYKFDEQVYAVKCIPIGTDKSKDDLKRECKILSLIDNRYVVRYYASWIEELTDEDAQELRDVFCFVDDDDDDEILGFSTTQTSTFAWGDRERHWSASEDGEMDEDDSGDGEMDKYDSGYGEMEKYD